MKEFTIISEEVFDHLENAGSKDEEQLLLLGCIEIHLEVSVEKTNYLLVFQTSDTYDNGAISSTLRAYDGDEGYLELQRYVDDICEFDELLEAIKEKSTVDEIWDEYVQRNYIRDESHYDGMDADSEHSCAKRRA